MIIFGDCLEAMRGMDATSVDAIVTDPPYGLGFMGKEWDLGIPGVHFFEAALRVAKPGTHLLAFGGCRTHHRLMCAIEDAGWEIRDTLGWIFGSGFPKSHNLKGDREGWGTALKPAWEPIILARKPLDGTVAANIQKWGTGAINVDGCRVVFSGPEDETESKIKNQHGDFGSGPMTNQVFGEFKRDRENYNPTGRWPANLLHDGSEGVLELFPETPGQLSAVGPKNGEKASVNVFGDYGPRRQFEPRADSGSAARFFYCAKASRKEREMGMGEIPNKPLHWSSGNQNPGSFQSPNTDRSAKNHHPTVKPLALMRYLCRLVTPPGGLVLDPFCGSGSTGIAAIQEGFRFVGIDNNAEYCEIARLRIYGQLIEKSVR